MATTPQDILKWLVGILVGAPLSVVAVDVVFNGGDMTRSVLGLGPPLAIGWEVSRASGDGLAAYGIATPVLGGRDGDDDCRWRPDPPDLVALRVCAPFRAEGRFCDIRTRFLQSFPDCLSVEGEGTALVLRPGPAARRGGDGAWTCGCAGVPPAG